MGFTLEIYYDARPCERLNSKRKIQILTQMLTLFLVLHTETLHSLSPNTADLPTLYLVWSLPLP